MIQNSPQHDLKHWLIQLYCNTLLLSISLFGESEADATGLIKSTSVLLLISNLLPPFQFSSLVTDLRFCSSGGGRAPAEILRWISSGGGKRRRLSLRERPHIFMVVLEDGHTAWTRRCCWITAMAVSEQTTPATSEGKVWGLFKSAFRNGSTASSSSTSSTNIPRHGGYPPMPDGSHPQGSSSSVSSVAKSLLPTRRKLKLDPSTKLYFACKTFSLSSLLEPPGEDILRVSTVNL